MSAAGGFAGLHGDAQVGEDGQRPARRIRHMVEWNHGSRIRNVKIPGLLVLVKDQFCLRIGLLSLHVHWA